MQQVSLAIVDDDPLAQDIQDKPALGEVGEVLHEARVG